MVKRRGRRAIADQTALRRVAEYIVAADEQGTRCSIRAAILQTSDGVPGNSPNAIRWRLQRKWRQYGPALLAEARQRRAKRRHVASVPMRGGFLGSAMLEVMRSQAELRAQMEELTRPSRTMEEVMRFQAELRAHMEELTRPSRAMEEVMRAIRGW